MLKFFNKIKCLFLGHTYSEFDQPILRWTSSDNKITIKMNFCYTCSSIFTRVFEYEVQPYVNTVNTTLIKEQETIGNDFVTIYFNNESSTDTGGFYRVYRNSKLIDQIEVIDTRHQLTAWDFKCRDASFHILSDVEFVFNKVTNPAYIYVPDDVYLALIRFDKIYKPLGGVNVTPVVSTGNAQGTVPQQKPVSTSVPGPGSLYKL